MVHSEDRPTRLFARDGRTLGADRLFTRVVERHGDADFDKCSAFRRPLLSS
jgi:hypothetical protein